MCRGSVTNWVLLRFLLVLLNRACAIQTRSPAPLRAGALRRLGRLQFMGAAFATWVMEEPAPFAPRYIRVRVRA